MAEMSDGLRSSDDETHLNGSTCKSAGAGLPESGDGAMRGKVSLESLVASDLL